ncbi:MAG: hypothetical protein HKN47_15335 [Pirellulaceae bacterium]|nr:hypothetical protein [Pirellulaceae bacterium]
MTLSQYRAAKARAAKLRTAKFRPTTRVAPSRFASPATDAEPKPESKPDASTIAQDKIPDAVLQTDRGTELAEQLRMLRYNESTLGSKHPAMETVREQIADIKDELDSLASDFRPEDGTTVTVDETTPRSLAQLSELDLRQLVLRLSTDVSTLRDRISELESEQGRISTREESGRK